MNKNLLMTAIAPHPPIIVPEVGKGEEVKANKTIKALKALSDEIVQSNPDTVVIITPHSEFNPYFFSVYSGAVLSGSFEDFLAPLVKISYENDTEFITELELKAKEVFLRFNHLSSATPLDHGSLVPLYYLSKACYKGKAAVINYTMLDKDKHKLFGKYIAETAEKMDRKIVFIASGDLSHKLTPGAPGGYNPNAKDFDELIVKSIQNGDYKPIADVSLEMRNIAGECGYNSIITALGAIGDKPCNNKVISYEAPFGVGYIVAKL